MSRDLRGRRVTVMGLGRFGGGAGVARWLAAQGARVTVTDVLCAGELAPALAALRAEVETGAVRLRLGGHREADFAPSACDLVVVNPAVPRPWSNRLLRKAAAAGVAMTTEIRLLVERLDRRRVIGVTGTAGKSTTAAMIHHALRGCGRDAVLGGNIGGSLLGGVDHGDRVVLELSSAMLYWLGGDCDFAQGPGWSPGVAVLTNLEPNHLDWHGSFEHYRRSKENIFRHQAPGDVALRGGTDAARAAPPLRVPGEHNRRNARLAAATACAAAGLDETAAADALRDFPGLPHRLQLVADAGGLRFYNDSKSTTPAATRLAVEAFDDPARVHLIAGGYDKGLDLSPIARLAGRLAGLYAVGATGRALAAAAPSGRAEHCGTLERAADRALDRMRPGDVLLLSPGCASWDQFDNYEARGDAFRRWVQEERRARV